MARAASPRRDANGLASLYPGGRLHRARQDVLRLLRVGATVVAVYAPRPGRARGSAGVRLRATFERLGLTYLKLGQYLAMRYDLLPGEVCRELEKLFEEVPAVPFEQ